MFDISFIVPVYNVEQYLDKCITSIINQKLNKYEIILVDDGSTDKSGIICDNYAENNENIVVIHRKNGGLSAARNTGIKNARGKYLVFLDSDDSLVGNELGKMIALCKDKNLDILCANYYNEFENGDIKASSIIPYSTDKVITGTEYIKASAKNKSTQFMVWMNIYRRGLVIDNNIYFPEGLNHEDEDWTPRIMIAAQRVCSYNKGFYLYYHRKNSISKDAKKFEKNFLDQLKVCYRLKEYSQTIKDCELRELLQDHIGTLFFVAVSRGNLVKSRYSHLTHYSFFDGITLSDWNKKKYILYRFNKKLFCIISDLFNAVKCILYGI